MMSKEFLKTVGIIGVSFGLVASPLTFAVEEEGAQGPVEQETDEAIPQTDPVNDPTAGNNAPETGPNTEEMESDSTTAPGTQNSTSPGTQMNEGTTSGTTGGAAGTTGGAAGTTGTGNNTQGNVPDPDNAVPETDPVNDPLKGDEAEEGFGEDSQSMPAN